MIADVSEAEGMFCDHGDRVLEVQEPSQEGGGGCGNGQVARDGGKIPCDERVGAGQGYEKHRSADDSQTQALVLLPDEIVYDDCRHEEKDGPAAGQGNACQEEGEGCGVLQRQLLAEQQRDDAQQKINGEGVRILEKAAQATVHQKHLGKCRDQAQQSGEERHDGSRPRQRGQESLPILRCQLPDGQGEQRHGQELYEAHERHPSVYRPKRAQPEEQGKDRRGQTGGCERYDDRSSLFPIVQQASDQIDRQKTCGPFMIDADEKWGEDDRRLERPGGQGRGRFRFRHEMPPKECVQESFSEVV